MVGQPILYKTTKEFLVQFGLKDLRELPTIKEFEELGRMELVEEAPAAQAAPAVRKRLRPRKRRGQKRSRPELPRRIRPSPVECREWLRSACRKSSRRPASPAAAKPRN